MSPVSYKSLAVQTGSVRVRGLPWTPGSGVTGALVLVTSPGSVVVGLMVSLPRFRQRLRGVWPIASRPRPAVEEQFVLGPKTGWLSCSCHFHLKLLQNLAALI